MNESFINFWEHLLLKQINLTPIKVTKYIICNDVLVSLLGSPYPDAKPEKLFVPSQFLTNALQSVVSLEACSLD